MSKIAKIEFEYNEEGDVLDVKITNTKGVEWSIHEFEGEQRKKLFAIIQEILCINCS